MCIAGILPASCWPLGAAEHAHHLLTSVILHALSEANGSEAKDLGQNFDLGMPRKAPLPVGEGGAERRVRSQGTVVQ